MSAPKSLLIAHAAAAFSLQILVACLCCHSIHCAALHRFVHKLSLGLVHTLADD